MEPIRQKLSLIEVETMKPSQWINPSAQDSMSKKKKYFINYVTVIFLGIPLEGKAYVVDRMIVKIKVEQSALH